ncbi:MAG: circadian clock KaiB family protein [Pyrinomonadaceae bacterium]
MKKSTAQGTDNSVPAESTDHELNYVLTLYVTASTPRSLRAIANIRKLCEQYLAGRYELDIVDISRDPEMAKADQLIAAPTLIKRLPLPLRRFIGDMSDEKRLRIGLDIR